MSRKLDAFVQEALNSASPGDPAARAQVFKEKEAERDIPTFTRQLLHTMVRHFYGLGKVRQWSLSVVDVELRVYEDSWAVIALRDLSLGSIGVIRPAVSIKGSLLEKLRGHHGSKAFDSLYAELRMLEVDAVVTLRLKEIPRTYESFLKGIWEDADRSLFFLSVQHAVLRQATCLGFAKPTVTRRERTSAVVAKLGELLHSGKFHEMTGDEIARAVGVSRKTLYGNLKYRAIIERAKAHGRTRRTENSAPLRNKGGRSKTENETEPDSDEPEVV